MSSHSSVAHVILCELTGGKDNAVPLPTFEDAFATLCKARHQIRQMRVCVHEIFFDRKHPYFDMIEKVSLFVYQRGPSINKASVKIQDRNKKFEIMKFYELSLEDSALC